MITRLSIKNFAIIKDLDISFTNGFNVLTGETGAGKSMITDAITLLMGARASIDFIRQGETFCEISGFFQNVPQSILEKLKEIDIDLDDEIIIRRVIKKDNPSRVYINSIPVSINFLQTIMETYFSILSQHQSQGLFKADVQLELLDSFLKLNKERDALRELYKDLLNKKKFLSELECQQQDVLKKFDYLQFQIKEIKDLDPSENEDIELAKFVQKAMASINVIKILNSIDNYIDENESGLSSFFTRATIELSKYLDVDEGVNILLEKVNQLIENSDTVSKELKKLLNIFSIDDEMLENSKERLSEINRLKKKFNCNSVIEVLAKNEKMKEELNFFNNFEEELKEQTLNFKKLERDYFKKAEFLSQERKKGTQRFANSIENILKFIGMKRASFFIELNTIEANSSGIDSVCFKISTNPGEPLKAINKVASGGELSRIMLAIQNSSYEIYNYGIQIYDEIDSGLGGDIAFKIGKLLKDISKTSQLLVITHIPQIAVFADNHIKVSKILEQNSSLVFAEKLKDRNKIEELSSMLGMKNENNVEFHIRDMINKSKNYLQT